MRLGIEGARTQFNLGKQVAHVPTPFLGLLGLEWRTGHHLHGTNL